MRKKNTSDKKLFFILTLLLIFILIGATVFVMQNTPTGKVVLAPVQNCWTDETSDSVKKARDLSSYLAKDVYNSYKTTAPELQPHFEQLQTLSQQLVSSFTSEQPSQKQVAQYAKDNKQTSQEALQVITTIQKTIGTNQGDAILKRFVSQLRNVFEEVSKQSTITIQCVE